jgi:hypothetical protein
MKFAILNARIGRGSYFSTIPISLNRTRNPGWEKVSRIHSLDSEEDHASARTWLDGFKESDIPKEAWEAGYSRSSGPGGQVSTPMGRVADVASM